MRFRIGVIYKNVLGVCEMKRLTSLMLIALMLMLAACGGGEPSSGSSGGTKDGKESDPIKIGTLFPLTGELALLGEESFRGVKLAVEEFNNNGGLNGRKVELVVGDAVDSDAAQSEANRLINQANITTIVGSYSSGVAFAGSEVAERNGVLYWELGAVADDITGRNYRSILRINPMASMLSVVHINFIKEVVAEKLGKDISDLKVVIAHEDSSYGTTIADEAIKLAKEEGINIVSVLPYGASSNDLSSVVLNIKKAEPDVLISVAYINDAILLSKQMKELDVEVPVIVGSGAGHTTSDFKDAVGEENAEGIFDIAYPQYHINKEFTPGMDKFIELYQEKYNGHPKSGHSLASYMGMKVVLDVITQTGGDVDPEKLHETALDYKVERGTTATGWGVEFDPDTGQNMLAEYYVHQWIDGKLVTVYPEEVALEEPKINE